MVLPDVGVIRSAVLDRMIENRGIRGQSGHREVVDVLLQCAVIQQITSNVIEPDTLAEFLQTFRTLHLHLLCKA